MSWPEPFFFPVLVEVLASHTERPEVGTGSPSRDASTRLQQEREGVSALGAFFFLPGTMLSNEGLNEWMQMRRLF
jgi:hypothetical protein